MRSSWYSEETTEEETVTEYSAKLNEYTQRLQRTGCPEVKTAAYSESWTDHMFIMATSF